MRWLPPLLFALLALIWGSTWLVIKVGYGGLGPFNVAALRFLLAGVLMAPLALLWRVRWPRGSREWSLVLFVGTSLFALDYGLIYWGEQFLASGLTAVLFAVLPIVTAFVAHAYLPAERLTARKLGGATLAFLGVAVLFGDSVSLDASKAVPMLAILASTFFAALAAVATKRHGHDLHPVALNAPAMLWGAFLLAVASWAAGDGFALPADGAPRAAVLYLAILGSIVTFLVYFHLLKTWSVTNLSFIAVATPLVALVLGLVVLQEVPGPLAWLGALLVVAGVAVAVWAPKRLP